MQLSLVSQQSAHVTSMSVEEGQELFKAVLQASDIATGGDIEMEKIQEAAKHLGGFQFMLIPDVCCRSFELTQEEKGQLPLAIKQAASLMV